MSLSDRDALELDRVCSDLADGRLDAAGFRRLETWLRESEAARAFYVRHAALEVGLHLLGAESQSAAADGVVPFPHTPAPKPSPARQRPLAWLTAVAAAAAVFLAVRVLIPNATRSATRSIDAEPGEPAGRLSAVHDARWGTARREAGDEVRQGDRLELTSGWAEVTFDSGARITLQGPAGLEVGSPWEATLGHGDLTAEIPAEAVGFRIANASVEAVEPDTRFGLSVDRRGATEVVVLEGSVEAAPRTEDGREQDPVRIGRGEGRRIARGHAVALGPVEEHLRRLRQRPPLPRRPTPVPHVHWAFDTPELPRRLPPTTVVGLPDTVRDARLMSHTRPEALSVEPGRWGRALHPGGDTWLRASFPGISSMRPHTLSLWIRLDGLPQSAGNVMLAAWPVLEGRFLHVGLHAPGDGAAGGALRLALGRREWIGTTPLADGRWHHLAVVIGPSRRVPGVFMWRQYVDGRLEAASVRRGGNRWPVMSGDPFPTRDLVWIGGSAQNRTFPGDIDELFLFDGELLPGEIRSLVRRNRPDEDRTAAPPLARLIPSPISVDPLSGL